MLSGWQSPEDKVVDPIVLNEAQIARHKEIIAQLSEQIDTLKIEIDENHQIITDLNIDISNAQNKSAVIIEQANAEAKSIMSKVTANIADMQSDIDGRFAIVKQAEAEFQARLASASKKQTDIDLLNTVVKSRLQELANDKTAILARVDQIKAEAADQISTRKDLDVLAFNLSSKETTIISAQKDLDERAILLKNRELELFNSQSELVRREDALSIEKAKVQELSEASSQAMLLATEKHSAVEAQKIEINKKIIEAQRATEQANAQIRLAESAQASVDSHKQELLKLIDQYNDKTGGQK